MQAIGQNFAVAATLIFLIAVFFRQVPVLGFFIRMATRAVFMLSPVMILVLVAGLVWFHGFRFNEETATRAGSPIDAPMPVERP